jgi:hypothetical protein
MRTSPPRLTRRQHLGSLPASPAGLRIWRHRACDLEVPQSLPSAAAIVSTKLWWRGESELKTPSLVHGLLSLKLNAAYDNVARR